MNKREQQQARYQAYIDCMNMRKEKWLPLISQAIFLRDYKYMSIKEITNHPYTLGGYVDERQVRWTKKDKELIKRMFQMKNQWYKIKEICEIYNVSPAYMRYHKDKWENY